MASSPSENQLRSVKQVGLKMVQGVWDQERQQEEDGVGGGGWKTDFVIVIAPVLLCHWVFARKQTLIKMLLQEAQRFCKDSTLLLKTFS